MTNDELNAIEARAQAATPGPWSIAPRTETAGWGTCIRSRAADLIVARMPGRDRTVRENDAAFIAHAREDVAALVAEVRRLRDRGDTP